MANVGQEGKSNVYIFISHKPNISMSIIEQEQLA